MSVVISDACTGCGLCEQVCPASAIHILDTKASVLQNRCLSCGHCQAVCRFGAVSANPQGRKAFTIHEPRGTEIEKLLQGKRSVREFRDDAIPREVIEELIRYGEMAPSSRNTRGRKYYVAVGSRVTELEGEVIRGLAGLTKPLRLLLPLLKIFSRKSGERLASLSRLFSAMQDAYQNGRHPVLCGAPVVICIASPKSNMQGKDDCVCAEQYLMLYAESIGLASCINGFTQMAHKNAERYFGVENGYRIEAAVMLGYPRYDYRKYIRYTEDIVWKE